MNTEMYIGPLIERGGKFAYDIFSQADGLRSSFQYPRIEQARYDRRAMVAELRSNPRIDIHLCETLGEFQCQLAQAQHGAAGRGDLGMAFAS
jgi:hypothetical protein